MPFTAIPPASVRTRAGHVIPEDGTEVWLLRGMIGHITYLSEETMEAKFGRKLKLKDIDGYTLQPGRKWDGGRESLR